MRMRVIICFLCLLAMGQAQAQTPDVDEDRYNSVTTYGVTTNTNSGILGGFAFRHSKVLPSLFRGKRQFRYLAVEVVNVKHPKEVQAQTNFTGARFIVGKQNYFFVIRPQYGREIALFTRTADEGIAINGILAAGPSIGLLKPYYIQYQFRPGQIRAEQYDPSRHDQSLIIGAGSFFQGFERSKINPGLNVKAAVAFELSAFRNNLTGLEIGFLAEGFANEAVIMPFATNRRLFTSGYMTLYFGNKK